MKKNTTFIAALIALCACLFGCSGSAFALDIPSSASGDYVANGYSCRFEYGIQNNGQSGVALRCTLPNSAQTVAITTGPAPCVSDGYMVPLNEWGGGGVKSMLGHSWLGPKGELMTTWSYGNDYQKATTPWVRVVGVTPSTLTAKVGLFWEIAPPANGGETIEFVLAQDFHPPSPYAGCAPAPAPSPIFYQRPWICGVVTTPLPFCGR